MLFGFNTRILGIYEQTNVDRYKQLRSLNICDGSDRLHVSHSHLCNVELLHRKIMFSLWMIVVE